MRSLRRSPGTCSVFLRLCLVLLSLFGLGALVASQVVGTPPHAHVPGRKDTPANGGYVVMR